MHLLNILLSLAAATVAIDVRIHDGGDCKGWSHLCTNLNPKVGISSPFTLSFLLGSHSH